MSEDTKVLTTMLTIGAIAVAVFAAAWHGLPMAVRWVGGVL